MKLPKSKYVHIFRRRRIGKTDYRKRKGVVVSRSEMFAVRMSNKYVYGQILRANPSGDLTLCSASSRDLRTGFGWKGSCKNLPAAYLTGYLLGKKALAKKIQRAIVYSGVNTFVHGSRMASAVRGAKDAGLDLKVGEEALPDEKRIEGGHLTNQKSSGFNPSEYPSHLVEVKSAIDKSGARA